MEDRSAVPLLEEFSAWSGAELQEGDFWRETLPESEIDALAEGLRGRSRVGAEVAPMTAGNILPLALRSRLPGLSDALIFGRGFFVLRRLPLERLSQVEAARLFASLAGHFGRLLGKPQEIAAAAHEDYAFAFAEADVAAKLCWRAPRAGGDMRLVSASALHNEMSRRCPDLLSLFFAPIGRAQPLFTVRGARLEVHLDSDFALLVAENGAESLSSDQRQAFVLFRALVRELALDVDFEPGDVLFVNTHRVLLAEGPHEDYAELGKGHSLMGLSLANEHIAVPRLRDQRKSARTQAAA